MTYSVGIDFAAPGSNCDVFEGSTFFGHRVVGLRGKRGCTTLMVVGPRGGAHSTVLLTAPQAAALARWILKLPDGKGTT